MFFMAQRIGPPLGHFWETTSPDDSGRDNPLSSCTERTSDLHGQVGYYRLVDTDELIVNSWAQHIGRSRGTLACLLGRTDPARQERPDPTCPPRKGCDTISPLQQNRRRAPVHYSETPGRTLPHYHHHRYT
ncbi:hypothetical protein PIB30_011149 [Stylosanthes scabra]|uniref:Uncharacterized protein n=1 Tax=Stylosanthes scabra TaxID=79078 RepID=A0ABU6Q6Q8_9FABA|nr:hypothetical protein [Stylosanthes scabra]